MIELDPYCRCIGYAIKRRHELLHVDAEPCLALDILCIDMGRDTCIDVCIEACMATCVERLASRSNALS